MVLSGQLVCVNVDHTFFEMRRGQNKTMFAGYFWEEQQLFFLPFKSKASVVDNWLLLFFLFFL